MQQADAACCVCVTETSVAPPSESVNKYTPTETYLSLALDEGERTDVVFRYCRRRYCRRQHSHHRIILSLYDAFLWKKSSRTCFGSTTSAGQARRSRFVPVDPFPSYITRRPGECIGRNAHRRRYTSRLSTVVEVDE
jgi:hypothetical protein